MFGGNGQSDINSLNIKRYTEGSDVTSHSYAPQFPDKHNCFLEGSQASLFCAGNSSIYEYVQ